MRIIYPKEINDLWEAIPDEYRKHPETAPEEYREMFELWKKKSLEYEEKVRRELFGF